MAEQHVVSERQWSGVRHWHGWIFDSDEDGAGSRGPFGPHAVLYSPQDGADWVRESISQRAGSQAAWLSESAQWVSITDEDSLVRFWKDTVITLTEGRSIRTRLRGNNQQTISVLVNAISGEECHSSVVVEERA